MNISEIIEAARTDLNDYFSIRPNVVWKEEDLQSYLYHRILVQEPELKKKLHREFPVIVEHSPRKWAGLLDLAITDECSNNFSLREVKIDYAIELKFVRDYRTGFSSKSLEKFKTECDKDRKKLLTKARNFKSETRKYFFAFRLTNSSNPQKDEVKRFFDGLVWDGIEYHYIECYTDGRQPEII